MNEAVVYGGDDISLILENKVNRMADLSRKIDELEKRNREYDKDPGVIFSDYCLKRISQLKHLLLSPFKGDSDVMPVKNADGELRKIETLLNQSEHLDQIEKLEQFRELKIGEANSISNPDLKTVIVNFYQGASLDELVQAARESNASEINQHHSAVSTLAVAISRLRPLKDYAHSEEFEERESEIGSKVYQPTTTEGLRAEIQMSQSQESVPSLKESKSIN